jgi:hypothetical protein
MWDLLSDDESFPLCRILKILHNYVHSYLKLLPKGWSRPGL